MRFQLRLAVLCAAITALSSVPPAGAATAPSGVELAASVFTAASPQSAYARLTPAERQAFDRVETPALTVRVTESAVGSTTAALAQAGFNGTFSLSDRWGENALAGNTLYTWWQATIVSISNGHVVGVRVYNYGYETSTPGWRSDGISSQTYNAGWEGRGLVVAHMVLGVAGWDIQHTTNCGQLRLNADANHYATSTSCDLN